MKKKRQKRKQCICIIYLERKDFTEKMTYEFIIPVAVMGNQRKVSLASHTDLSPFINLNLRRKIQGEKISFPQIFRETGFPSSVKYVRVVDG